LLQSVMVAARCEQFLRDLVQIGRPGICLLSPADVRRSAEVELEFSQAHCARKRVIGFTLTGFLSSRLAGIPLAASHGASFVPPVFERGLAPVPTTMSIPGTEWLPDWLKRKRAYGGTQRLTDPARFLNDVAAELGVEPVPSLAA
jgi:hypothetical protein